MNEPSSTKSSLESTTSTDISTTPANAPSKRGGKVGRAVKRILDAFWRALKRGIWGPKNNDSDAFWEEKAYGIIRSFVIVGVAILLWLVVFSPLLYRFLENWGISEKELVRNAYYLFIFIGAGLAATLATWRGRQSEQQLCEFKRQIQDSRLERQNSRFERALDMATDQKSRARRSVGFQILGQMLFAWGENFDDATEERIGILTYLLLNSFKRTMKQEKTFKKLYENSKISYGADEIICSQSLFDETHKPDINVEALRLWIGIVNWNMRRRGNPARFGIYTTKMTPNRSPWFIFSGGGLRHLQFFVKSYTGEIIPSTQQTMGEFKRSCFLIVEMHGATVDYVNFSGSHFSKINLEEENKENCQMSCIGTIFDEANLIDCNFRGADFKGASFVEITTIRVIFDKANLTDCQFEGANLGGASFVGTDISGSDFRLAKNLTQGQFEKAYWIRPARPQFPEGWTDNFVYSLAKHAQD